jgi:GAF domain
LQVGSGLTAESIARRQLLRCNNAESDPRVNLDACRALGIASIVVLPLLRRNGEVRGLFELFSDHPYAFEERDLIALERMADLTLTALDLAEQAPNSAAWPQRKPSRPAESLAESLPGNLPENAPGNLPGSLAENLPESLLESLRELSEASPAPGSELAPGPVSEQRPSAAYSATYAEPGLVDERATGLSEIPPSAVATPAAVAVPEAMLRVQKCESCGFPVSEGRTLCLDCEKKTPGERKPGEEARGAPSALLSAVSPASLSSSLPLPAQDEFVPAFLEKSPSERGSWLSNHINLLVIVVVLLGILVAVVLFR